MSNFRFRFPVCKRGNTYKHKYKFNVGSGSINATTIRLMVKRYATDADDDALANIDNAGEGGIDVLSPTNPCEIEFTIPDDVTAAFPVETIYAGIQLELPNGETEEIEDIDPAFQVTGDVVHTVASP